MEPINLYQIKKNTNFWLIAFCVLLLIMILRGCESPEPKIVYKEVKVKNDSIDNEVISKYRHRISFLYSQNQKKDKELQTLYKNRNKALKRIKTNKDAKEVLKNKDSVEVAQKYTDYDYIDSMLVVTTEMLGNEKTSSILKDSIINQFEVKESNLINFAKEQEKIIKKQKRTNNFYKYALPVGIVLGLVVGGAAF
jgi:hypothetical protein